MKSTTLFSLYAASIILVVVVLAFVSLYSLERSRWWDERIQLAQESYALHLRLEANVFRLFKQHGDALLVGDRDSGVAVRDLSAKVTQNLADIRTVIAREIDLVGEEEIEELELLDQMTANFRQINTALVMFKTDGEPIETAAQVAGLADLLDRRIDVQLTEMIDKAIAEETEEVEETLADAASFRAWNQNLIYALLVATFGLLAIGFLSFNHQIRLPLIGLKAALLRLRQADYTGTVALTGSREFRDLGVVLDDMARSLADRDATREENRQRLEATVAARTAELQNLIDRLETGHENRKRLMADISHELRTPLTIILGEAEVAMRNTKGLGADVLDALASIRDSARHTNQIVDDMLTVARQEAGQLRLDRRKVDLRTVLRDAVDMFRHKVDMHLPDVPATLQVDEVRIRQTVLALLQNARRYGGPSITAQLSAMTDGFRITVSDDGPGLSADEKQHAFDRFFRGSNASTRGIDGNGLGLPIVKSIVEAHGGTVILQDAPAGGLLVHIDLPEHRPVQAISNVSELKQA